MIVDANLLLYAVDSASGHHRAARTWLEEAINGTQQVGLPWPSLLSFVRIATHPRINERPLSLDVAWRIVEEWLDCDSVWVPAPTSAHREVLGRLLSTYQLGGNLVPDAHLAALAIEHGLPMCSADSDFARISELTWINPLR
jgi:uncharacterized protein